MDFWVIKVKEKVKHKIKFLKMSKQICNTSPVMQGDEVKQYLKDHQIEFSIASLDKASNKFSFLCGWQKK